MLVLVSWAWKGLRCNLFPELKVSFTSSHKSCLLKYSYANVGTPSVAKVHSRKLDPILTVWCCVQAAMAGDFAIGQFRFLERLLLVHGRWCYRRISLMVVPFPLLPFITNYRVPELVHCIAYIHEQVLVPIYCMMRLAFLCGN